MTWKDKLEIGLKEDAPYRKDNLPESEVSWPGVSHRGLAARRRFRTPVGPMPSRPSEPSTPPTPPKPRRVVHARAGVKSKE